MTLEEAIKLLKQYQGALMPGAERMYRAIRYYLGEATALSTLQAENEKLRDEMKQERAHRLHAEQHADAFLEDCKRLNAELEQVKADRDAAIEYLREIEWCAGCKHFGGLDGCKKWAMGQCTEKHDLYEFIGPQKED